MEGVVASLMSLTVASCALIAARATRSAHSLRGGDDPPKALDWEREALVHHRNQRDGEQSSANVGVERRCGASNVDEMEEEDRVLDRYRVLYRKLLALFETKLPSEVRQEVDQKFFGSTAALTLWLKKWLSGLVGRGYDVDWYGEGGKDGDVPPLPRFETPDPETPDEYMARLLTWALGVDVSVGDVGDMFVAWKPGDGTKYHLNENRRQDLKSAVEGLVVPLRKGAPAPVAPAPVAPAAPARARVHIGPGRRDSAHAEADAEAHAAARQLMSMRGHPQGTASERAPPAQARRAPDNVKDFLFPAPARDDRGEK